MNAVVYARTSKDDDAGESHSIPQQIEECKKYCRQHGFEILEVIQDANRSGRFYPTGFDAVLEMDFTTMQYAEKSQSKNKTRDGLARALKMLNANTVLVCRDITRLFRPLSGSLFQNWLPQQFNKAKTTVHTVLDGKIDYSKWDTMFLQTIQSMPVDNEVQKRARNSKYELDRLKDSGYLVHRPTMLGYISNGVQKVSIVESEAKIVRRIFDLKIQGCNHLQIVKTLNQEKAKNKDWRIQEILKVLDRPQYFGFQKNTKGELIKSNVFPVIVEKYSIDDYKRIQAGRKQQRALKVRTGSKYTHLMSGLLRCGFCGCNMVITHAGAFGTGEKTFYYICARSYQHDKKNEDIQGCRKVRITENTIDEFFTFLSMQQVILQEKLHKQNGNIQERMIVLEEEREAIQKKINSLFDSASDFSNKLFTEQSKRLESKLKEIDDRKAELSLIPIQKIHFNEEGESTGFSFTVDDKVSFFRSMIENVKVFFSKVTIKFKGEEEFDVERVPDRFSRKMPEVMVSGAAYAKQHKVKIQIVYKSHNYKKTAAERQRDPLKNSTERPVFQNDWLIITSLGENPEYGKGRLERGVVLRKLPEYVLQNVPLPAE